MITYSRLSANSRLLPSYRNCVFGVVVCPPLSRMFLIISSSLSVAASWSVNKECGLIRCAKIMRKMLDISVFVRCLLGAADEDMTLTANPRCAIVFCARRKSCVGNASLLADLHFLFNHRYAAGAVKYTTGRPLVRSSGSSVRPIWL